MQRLEQAIGTWDLDPIQETLSVTTPDDVKEVAQTFMLGQALELLCREDRKHVRDLVDKVRSGQAIGGFRLELRTDPEKGMNRTVLVEGQLLSGVQAPRLVGTWRDVAKTADRERELLAAVNRMKRFTAVLSHDIQGPLRHIALYSDLLVDALGPTPAADQRELLDGLRERARHLQAVVKRLLSFASGTIEVRRDRLRLDHAVQGSLSLLAEAVARRDASIQIDSMPDVIGDPILMQSVFQALLTNAIDHCDRRPSIVISGSSGDDGVVVTIKDNARSIARAHAERIFDPFYAVPATDAGGLGLFTASIMVAEMGGTLRLAASGEDGNRFEIGLPAP